jgi:hypothetical protein
MSSSLPAPGGPAGSKNRSRAHAKALDALPPDDAPDERPDPVWGAPCILERTYSLADGPVELSGELDCNDPTVHGAAYLMSLWPMCFEVPENTRVRMSVEADHGRSRMLLSSQEPVVLPSPYTIRIEEIDR